MMIIIPLRSAGCRAQERYLKYLQIALTSDGVPMHSILRTARKTLMPTFYKDVAPPELKPELYLNIA